MDEQELLAECSISAFLGHINKNKASLLFSLRI